ncbi:unnamed protein product [Paramecium pentaurelia]|uniref:Transmembrane protein n=1 Tax=Paramecium pentaurelia TaxID=43138 RepID=A0A8S1S3S1_9CILI|nr:unnamed protein product [Paramecium pentaurelia]
MYKSSTSLTLKSDPKITERSIYTMKTIRTERESSIQKRIVENAEKQSRTRENQHNYFYCNENNLDYNNKIQQITKNTNHQGINDTEKNQKKKETKLITQMMYTNQLQQKQKEFIKLITICICLLMISVIIFHKKEPQQIKSLF